MKPTKILLPLLFGSFLSHQATAAPNTGSATQYTKPNTLHFIENKGQVVDQNHNPRPDIDFKIPAGNGLNIFMGSGKIHYQWSRTNTADNSGKADEAQTTTTMYRMDVILLGANPHAVANPEQKQPYYEQLYLTHTGADGATAHTFRRLTYRDVYPHIDWVLYINDQGKLQYDFIIRPGGKVSDIRLQYAGADSLQYNADGSMTAFTPSGSVTESAPICFQHDGQPVSGKFLLENNTLRFATTPHQGTLTIDPVLEWATYFGGTGDQDVADAVTGDYMGNVYISGYTLSTANIATSGAFLDTFGGSNAASNIGDAFLAKYNCSGNLEWATYYGGKAGERARAVSCDPKGNLYMAGFVNRNSGNPSLNLATAGSHQDTFGGGGADLFLVKFSTSGQRLWSTYYGGSGNESTTSTQGTTGFIPFAVSCDDSSNVYLAGYTNSTDGIATSNAYQPLMAGGYDAFVVKFDSTGRRQWGTYYGGSGDDCGNALATDRSGHVYLAGTTTGSTGMNTLQAHQTVNNGGTSDAFLVQFNSAGQRQWATYYGGTNTDEGHALSCDTAGNVFFAGRTKSTDHLATPGSFQDIFKGGLWDAFLVKFDASGIRQWGTYFGGINKAAVLGHSCIAADISGSVYISGVARDLDSLSTPGSYQELSGGTDDAFLAKFDGSGMRTWCTYYGGAGTDNFQSAYADRFGNVYAAGNTGSTTNMATVNGYQATFPGGTTSAFLVKFREDNTIPRPDTIWGNTTVCAGATHTYAIPKISGALSYTWTLPPGWSGSSATDTIIVTVGTGTDTIRVAAGFSCGSSIDRMLIVTVTPEADLTSNAVTFCAGDSVLLESTTTTGMSWQWLRNGMIIPGKSDSTLLALDAGDYRVVTTVGQCTDTSDVFRIHALPDPVITQDGQTLRTETYYASYQWYYGSQTITGATTPDYPYVAEGAYRVSVTDTNGCSGMSDLFTPVYIGSVTAGNDVRVYPNPAKSMIHVIAENSGSVLLTLSTMDGREVLHAGQPGSINISTLADGLYLLQVRNNKGQIIHKEKLVKASL